MGASHCKSVSCLVCWPWVFCRWGYKVFNLSRDLTSPPHWRVMQIYGWELIAECHHPSKFCDHKHCGSVCIMSRDILSFYGWKPFTLSYRLAMFGGHWSSVSGDIKYLICHVISQKHVIEGSSNFMSEASSWYIMTLPSLVATDIVVVEINCF